MKVIIIAAVLCAGPALADQSITGAPSTYAGTCCEGGECWPEHTPGQCREIDKPESPSWHLLTQTRSGTITLLKSLTKHECEFARARALGLPATPAEEEAEAKRRELAMPPCPKKGDLDFDADLPHWMSEHPFASGCKSEHGGSMSWTTGWDDPGSIKTAECFQ